MLSRKDENYIIMTVIYMELNDFNFGKNLTPRNASNLMKELCIEKGSEKVPNFVTDMVNLTLMHYGEAVNAIIPYLKEWKWERIPLITQAILLMSWTHFYKVEKIAKAIIIDVAINLAKEYINEKKQVNFINAILDNILK